MKAPLRNLLIVLGVAIFVLLLWYFRHIVIFILVAGVLSIMGRPLVALLSGIRLGRLRFPRAVSALITLIIIWGVIVLFFVIFIPLITRQINYFSTIDTGKIIQIVEEPINKLEKLLSGINPDINNQ
ncbi:MAG: hypothetical protein WCE64_05170 [Bacteroidales bacterium]